MHRGISVQSGPRASEPCETRGPVGQSNDYIRFPMESSNSQHRLLRRRHGGLTLDVVDSAQVVTILESLLSGIPFNSVGILARAQSHLTRLE